MNDSSDRIAGLPATGDERARTLILGSMPSQLSLQRQQYYGNPRNAFWTIMAALFGGSPDLPYPERLSHLTSAGVALWDVVRDCVRPGSADAAIRDAAVNDLASFVRDRPRLRAIYFNGQKAAQLFEQRARHGLEREWAGLHLETLHLETLPSSSPAHAALSLPDKIAAWRTLRDRTLA